MQIYTAAPYPIEQWTDDGPIWRGFSIAKPGDPWYGGGYAPPLDGSEMERTMHGFHRKAQGFTLLELLVAIVIIGLLAGYVAPRYFAQVGRSEIQVAKAQIESLKKALDQYRLDMRRYPSAE